MGKGAAFCPAHITGFFKSYLGEDGYDHGKKLLPPNTPPESLGSTGAGFSIKHGVTARVSATKDMKGDEGTSKYHNDVHNGMKTYDGDGDGDRNQALRFKVSTSGHHTDGRTDITREVLDRFLEIDKSSRGMFFDIEYEIAVPVGYGLGVSGAVAMSLSLALDQALHTGLAQDEIGRIAHNAEIKCKTGLGDVLASFHGGFEIRTRPGAPGIGRVQKIQPCEGEASSIAVACFAPISTNMFIKERLTQINGLGGKMVGSLLKTKSCKHFQEMSLRFARYADVITPRMQTIIDRLSRNGINCGVALFGETVFTMIPKGDEHRRKALGILKEYPGGTVIESMLDSAGARVLDDDDDNDDNNDKI